MTSPVERITVRYPDCGTEYETSYRGSYNISLERRSANLRGADLAEWERKTKEYMREMNRAECPSCGKVVRVSSLTVDRANDGTEVWTIG